MTRTGPFLLLALTALAGCTHARHRPGPAPTGAHNTIGKPYAVDGEWQYPRAFDSYDRTGIASIIPPGHDAATADGEAFHQSGLMAQSPVLPLPSLVRIINLDNGRSLVVRVNDRGPDHTGRVIAVTRHVARMLEFTSDGLAEVRVSLLARRSQTVQGNLGAGPHLTAAPVASVQASALPPPPGASGIAGAPSLGVASRPTPISRPVATNLSGVVHVGRPDPGPLYVQMGGFGSGSDARSLMARLAGLPGTVVPEPGIDRTLYAVRIGPYRSASAADAALRDVLRRGVSNPEIVVH